MPYLKEGRKKEVALEMKRACTDGDYNYLYTRAYLKIFTANPSYATIASIGKAARHPNRIEAVESVEDFLIMNGVPLIDREEARDEALAEFRRRIVSKYEDYCIVQNGDLQEFRKAEQAIQEKFTGEVR